ncbi:hypothetical protein C8R45DRAFT_544317 [Mycena sanguinolenta]|nr:hypothetical protein C8R45DRAFT_544317 [Mycena sanguinolenta]
MTFGSHVTLHDTQTHRCPHPRCGQRVPVQRTKDKTPYLVCFGAPIHRKIWHYFDQPVPPSVPALAQSAQAAAPAPAGQHGQALVLASHSAPAPHQSCTERSCRRKLNRNCRHNLCKDHCIAAGNPCNVHRVASTSRPSNDAFTTIAAQVDLPFHQTRVLANLDLLQRHQREAALDASLPLLPPSPTRSQEEREHEYMLQLAVGSGTPPRSPPRPVASSSHSLLPVPDRRILLVYWPRDAQPPLITVLQDCPSWATTWPGVRLDDFAEHLAPSDTFFEFYSVDFSCWIRVPLSFTQIVLSDQLFLVRRVGVHAGRGEAEHIGRLRTFLRLPPLPAAPSDPALNPDLIDISDDKLKPAPRKRARKTSTPTNRVRDASHSVPQAEIIDISSDDDEPAIKHCHTTKRRRSVNSPTPSLTYSTSASSSFGSLRSLSPSPQFLDTFSTK